MSWGPPEGQQTYVKFLIHSCGIDYVQRKVLLAGYLSIAMLLRLLPLRRRRERDYNALASQQVQGEQGDAKPSMYVCLMSWGPTEGQQTKFCSFEIIQSTYCSLGENSS